MMISVIIFLLFHSQKAHALDLVQLNPVCLTGRWTNDLLMKISSRDEHPFSGSCTYIDLEKGELSEAKSNSEKMNLNVYMQTLPEKTPGGASTRKFFLDLRNKILEKIKGERSKMKAAQECLKSKPMNDCIPVPESTYTALGLSEEDRKDYKFTDVVKDARFNLVLASRPESAIWGKMRDKPGYLNVNMHDLGIYKKFGWDMSVGQESAEARQVLNSYFDQAHRGVSELKKTDIDQKIKIASSNDEKELAQSLRRSLNVESRVNSQRQEHYAAYSLLMGTFPILQFIESENPDKKEVESALIGTLNSLEHEEKWIKKLTADLEEGKSLDKDLLKLMLYNSEIKEILGENGNYCGLARDFVQLQEAKNLGFDVGVYLPVMALSIVAPYASLPTRSALFLLSGVGTIGTSLAVSAIKQDRIDKAAFTVVGRFDPKDSDEEMNARFEKLNELATDRDLELFFGVLGATEIRAAGKAAEQTKLARQRALLLEASKMKHNNVFFANDYTILTRSKLKRTGK